MSKSSNISKEQGRRRHKSAESATTEYPVKRRKSRAVKVGNVIIGGGFPISIQSMTNTDTRDIDATVAQIRRLEKAGCDIVRVAVLNKQAAGCLDKIKEQILIPLVADIHFSHKLALEAIRRGVDKVRINPGNIGPEWKVAEVVKAAGDNEIAIRVGVNSGSLPKDLIRAYGSDNPQAFVDAAFRELEILEKHNFQNTVISLKSTNIYCALAACKTLAGLIDYPFHIGITEAGTEFAGTIKSAVGIGAILATGIGDTIRVSLTADPVQEIIVGKQILKSLELKHEGVEIISCPTCGRCQIDLIGLARRVEEKTRNIKAPLKVAIMGCVVNGPGEARAADIGIAGETGKGVLFARGNILRTVNEGEMEAALMAEIERMANQKSNSPTG